MGRTGGRAKQREPIEEDSSSAPAVGAATEARRTFQGHPATTLPVITAMDRKGYAAYEREWRGRRATRRGSRSRGLNSGSRCRRSNSVKPASFAFFKQAMAASHSPSAAYTFAKR